jgi:hypothetical protein
VFSSYSVRNSEARPIFCEETDSGNISLFKARFTAQQSVINYIYITAVESAYALDNSVTHVLSTRKCSQIHADGITYLSDTFYAVVKMVQALCYKPKGRGFESRGYRWIFFSLPNPSCHTMTLEFTHPLTEVITIKYFWG